ncbi:MAG: polysaccharide deacetylase family protein [Rhizobiaceae bacterium]
MASSKSKIEPPVPDENTCMDALHQELDLWQSAGKKPRLFLRDDDAIEVTSALDKLIGPCEKFGIPLLLATIPKPANEALGARILKSPLVRGAVHGYRHKNHSPMGEKTCELGNHRPLDTVIGELKEGREKLLELFDGNLSDIIVPPWNRIHDQIINRLQEIGFNGLSTHAWLKHKMPLPMINTHVDIMHWSAGTIGREHNWVLNQVTYNLEIARQKGGRAIGILSHHLAHDDKAWAMLDKLYATLENKVDWVAADDLINEPAEPIS